MTDTEAITSLLAGLQSNTPALVVGSCILLLVLLGRLPILRAQWERLPAAYRPLVPAVLGLLAGVGEALASGRPWVAALVTGIVSGLPGTLAALPSQVVRREPEVIVATDPANDPEHVTLTRKGQ